MNELKTKTFEEKLMSNYGMSLEQFKQLDGYTQNKIIEGLYVKKDEEQEEKKFSKIDEMKKKAEIASGILNKVNEMVNEIVEFERTFVDDFGMSIDQFERLDFDDQEKLINKVTRLNRKKSYLAKLRALFPIIDKTKEKKKIKSIFKKK